MAVDCPSCRGPMDRGFLRLTGLLGAQVDFVRKRSWRASGENLDVMISKKPTTATPAVRPGYIPGERCPRCATVVLYPPREGAP